MSCWLKLKSTFLCNLTEPRILNCHRGLVRGLCGKNMSSIRIFIFTKKKFLDKQCLAKKTRHSQPIGTSEVIVCSMQKGFGVIKTKYYREKKKLKNCLHNYGKHFPNNRESCPLKLLQFCAFSLQLKRFSKRFYASLVKFYHFYSVYSFSFTIEVPVRL